jgi:hypothetical protein
MMFLSQPTCTIARDQLAMKTGFMLEESDIAHAHSHLQVNKHLYLSSSSRIVALLMAQLMSGSRQAGIGS